MRNKEIIFVSNALANGGAGRVLTVLADHFAQAGHQVGILVFNRRDDEYDRRSDIETNYAPSQWAKAKRHRRLGWIRRTVRQNPDAVVVAFEYFVNIDTLAACLGLPNRIVVSERNDPARVGNALASDTARRLLYRTADALVCQTSDAANYFSDRITKQVILNPMRPDLPAPVEEGKRRKTVVSFGRLEDQKNLPMLIRAFAQFHEKHPDYTLEIYGDGSQEASLRQLINSLSLTRRATVLPARPDIHNVVRECAMFVLPSDYEGLSNSMIEAMALGIPTICTDCPCGGARMVIEHGRNGILTPVGDVDSLVNAMCTVANDDALAQSLGEEGAKIRAALSLDAIADEWSSVILAPSR